MMGRPEEALTLAIPRGRPTPEVVALLGRAGLDASSVLSNGRGLVSTSRDGAVRFLMAKPFDVPAYVEAGAADLGVAGKDVLMELEPAVVELADLGVGRCRMVVAGPRDGPDDVAAYPSPLRVATRYPRVAARFFRNLGLAVHVVALHGSIELAPQVGLADVIVDLVQTGRTLQANALKELVEIAPISARLVANPVRWRVRHEAIMALLLRLEACLRDDARAAAAPL